MKATTDMAPATELLVKYDLSVDGEGLKAAMKTMLNLGQVFSGKSREAFAREVKPYLKVRQPPPSINPTNTSPRWSRTL